MGVSKEGVNMADLVAFSEFPLQLVFKVRQLKIHLPNDTVNQVLTDVLNELALYLELYITEAQKAKTERKAVAVPGCDDLTVLFEGFPSDLYSFLICIHTSSFKHTYTDILYHIWYSDLKGNTL